MASGASYSSSVLNVNGSCMEQNQCQNLKLLFSWIGLE